MSGRRCRALNLSRAERRRAIKRTATPPKVLAKILAEVRRREKKAGRTNRPGKNRHRR